MTLPTFRVIDTITGKEADEWEIALHEEWAKHLCYCDMDGFAIMQDGTLILCDECGSIAYCPEGRFKVELQDEAENTIPDAPLVFWDIKGEGVGAFCTRCKYKVKYRETLRFSYCPRCGVRIGVNEDGKRFVYKWYGRKMPQ